MSTFSVDSDHSLELQSQPSSATQTVRSFYNSHSLNCSKVLPDAWARSHNLALAQRMGINPGNYVLDAGCGVGIPAIHIAQSYPGVRIEGLTVSEVEAAEAQIRITQANLIDRVRVQVGDFHYLPFPDDSFDVVFFNDSIKYSLSLPQVLAEVRRVLRPSGTLYITELFIKKLPHSPEEQQALDNAYQGLCRGSHIVPLDRMAEIVWGAGFQNVEQTDHTNKWPIQDLRLAVCRHLYPNAPLFYGDVKAVKPTKPKTPSSSWGCGVVSTHTLDRHDENVRFIEEHQQIFDLENIYPLGLFKQFVAQESQQGGVVVNACNIEYARCYPGRLYYAYERSPSDPAIKITNLKASLSFLHQVTQRPDVQIDLRLLEQFLRTGLDPTKVTGMSIGIDGRPEISKSRAKVCIQVKDYPEKIATALALCDEHRDWANLIVNGVLLIGFDFFFNNKAAIEVYPTF